MNTYLVIYESKGRINWEYWNGMTDENDARRRAEKCGAVLEVALVTNAWTVVVGQDEMKVLVG